MKFLSFIFMVCLCLHNFKNTYSKDVCEKPISPEGEVGPIIKIPNQFYFNLEATFEDKKEVTSFVEYYDHPGLRGVITQWENGGSESVYYSFDTNEVFTVKDSVCTVSDLSTDQNSLIIGQPRNGSSVMFSPARMLFLEDRGVYMGTETIRGIPCYHWKSCQEWSVFSAKMNVHWYFAVDNYWSTAQSSNYHIPVRCDVDGIARFTAFHHIYDFFHFRSGLPDDPTIFETPDGVYCPNRKITKQLPSVPLTMSFYTEIVTESFPVVATMKEEYDHLAFLTKFTYTALPLYQKFSANEVVEIHDFLTGVAYVTDTVTGKCKTRPIPHSNLDSTELNPHDVRMATAKHFFEFPKDKYSYEGIKTVRDVKTETWIGTKVDWPKKGSDKSTWEWHYDYGKSVDSQVIKSKAVPVEFNVHLPDESYFFSVFAFSDIQPRIYAYDVSACYLHSDREKFALSITNLIKLYVQQNTDTFKLYVISAISTTIGIRPLRIQNLKVMFGEVEIIVTFDLTDVAPTIGDVKDRLKEKSFSAAVNELRDLLKKEEFIITIFSLTSGEKTAIRPTEMTFDEVLYKTTPRTTYTKGAMAGLGIGMTLLGLIIALAVSIKVLS
ncbi:uncharacterized protein LOC115216761 isoform X2 [Octopus sinensis]|nr:uncharacterized protein LOC115216761 isoform X2 [Octopus sinensis]